MEILILPLAIMGNVFILVPLAALVPAGVLGWLYFKPRKISCLLASLLWIAYAVYEYAIKLRILCSGECNNRVDLLLIYPLLIAISIWAVIDFIRHRKTMLKTEPDT